MVEEKEKEKENLIEIRMVKEMVPRKFHKYLKMFEKKEKDMRSCHRPQRMLCTEKGEDISIVKNREREGAGVCDIQPSKLSQTSPVFFVPKKDGKKRIVQEY